MTLNRIVKFSLLSTFALAVSIGMTGCHGHRAPVAAWYNVYGQHCGDGYPSPGCNFYSNGYKIQAGNDPYFSSTAWNNDGRYDIWGYYDSYGYYQVYTGYGWHSPDGILYDSYGYALNQTGQDEGRDVVADSADEDEALVVKAGKSMAQKYGMSEETAIQVAREVDAIRPIVASGRRSRTDVDWSEWTKRFTGSDVATVSKALSEASKGNAGALDGAVDSFANHWGFSHGTAKVVLKDMFRQDAAAYNVQ